MKTFPELFRSYNQAHGRYHLFGTFDEKGKAQGKALTAPGVPLPEDWEGHLTGQRDGLGMLPLLDDDQSVMWGAIDVDIYPVDHAALERDIENLPLVMTKSKSNGAHLWLFCKEPISAELVVARLQEWAAALGYGGVEVFPKQTGRMMRKGVKDVGNWINLPYYGNTRRCIYQGQEVNLDVFIGLAEMRAVTQEVLEKIVIVEDIDNTSPFWDGPPCLQMIRIQDGPQEGQRNNFMFAAGVYFKAKYGDQWVQELQKFNQTCPKPLGATEISQTTGSLAKRNYNYHCSKAPLVQFCNRALCIKREFGIARGGSDELNINLSGLTKITTNPPQWLVNVDGVRVSLDNTNDLDQNRFRRFSIENVHKIPVKITAKKWDQIVQDLLDKVEVVEAPEDASPAGQLIEHLNRFISVNGQSESRDMLLTGRVFISEDGLVLFRATDFFSYLKRERFTDLKTTSIYAALHNVVGVAKDRFNCKGATVSYWAIEVAKLGGRQTQAFDVPDMGNVFGEEDKDDTVH